jgi:thymidylate synthase (FAD)
MGTDLSVVNAARVSFGKKSEWETVDSDEIETLGGPHSVHFILSDRDKGLIQFLARGCTSGDWDNIKYILYTLSEEHGWGGKEAEEILNHVKSMPTHWTPFGHTAITLHIKAPIFVARQLGKHQVGMVWNEVSRRYVTDEPKFFYPKEFRKAAENVKQGSSDEEVTMLQEPLPRLSHSGGRIKQSVGVANALVKELYEEMLASGVCPEQARMVLPQSMYTEWYWTGNLYSFANVFIQRTDSHAQREVQDIARQIGEIIAPLYPVSWAALTGESK